MKVSLKEVSEAFATEMHMKKQPKTCLCWDLFEMDLYLTWTAVIVSDGKRRRAKMSLKN